MNHTYLVKLIFLVFIYGHANELSAADTLQLTDAIARKRISVDILGNGGLSSKAVGLHVSNNVSSTLNIEVKAGQHLSSKDDQVQDLMILEGTLFVLAPKEKKEIHLAAACIQLSNHAPKNGEIYALGQMADGPLLEVADLVSKNGFFNPTAQAGHYCLNRRKGKVQILTNPLSPTTSLVT